MKLPTPVQNLEPAYFVPRAKSPIDLWIDANEGPLPQSDWCAEIEPERVRRYPKRSTVSEQLSQLNGLPEDHIVVSNGGDDIIDRLCRLYLDGDRNLVVAHPSFVMIERYANLTHCEVRRVQWWDGEFPADDYRALIDQNTGIIAIVTPNNPTGLCAPTDVILDIARSNPQALVMVDLAYVEFADEDPTFDLITMPNICMVRTLSKAFGLAGLRVGYGVGHPEVVGLINALGSPYPISSASLAIAERALESGVSGYVDLVREGRKQFISTLNEMGVDVTASQGNYVFVSAKDGARLRDAFAGLGIGIRAWPGSDLNDYCRITIPDSKAGIDRVDRALRTAFRPDALIFDLDGVIADVRASYRTAIVDTAKHFGLEVQDADVHAIKAEGDANNDWVVTHRLLKRAGITVDFQDVKDTFEAMYQGDGETTGLWTKETMLVTKQWLLALKRSRDWQFGVVTGRPRRDLERFLKQHDLTDVFETTVCMEDAKLKPDPAPVLLALKQMGATYAWMFGDTPDDMRAARGAGVIPVGVTAPGESSTDSLLGAGAGFVLNRLDQFEWTLA